MDAVRPGVTAEHIDSVARAVITEAGLGEYFIHRTGHGIGIEEHEDPYLVAGNDTALVVGHAFSVEPGIYLPGRFGMRLEDIVVVGEDGAVPLNTVDHSLVGAWRDGPRHRREGGTRDRGLARVGRASAEALAADGARLVLCARSEDAAPRRRAGRGGRAEPRCSPWWRTWPIPATPDRLVAAAVERFGRLDIVVANTGGPPPGNALDVDDDAIRGRGRGQPAVVRCAWCGGTARTCGPRDGDGCAASRRTRSSSPFPGWPCPTRPARPAGVGQDRRRRPRRRGSGITLNLVCPGPHATERMRELGGGGAGPWAIPPTSAGWSPSCARPTPAS